MAKAVLAAIICIILSACSTAPAASPTQTPVPASATPPSSAWGDVQLIAQAEQSTAPAVLTWFGGTLLAWTGADNNEARHYMQGRMDDRILALKAYYPFQQRLFPADSRTVRLLWLDRDAQDDGLRLMAATASQDAVAEQGPNPVSQIRASHYDALVLPDSRLLAVWSGGTGVLNNLYLSTVDVRGRPTSAKLIRQAADFPDLAQAGETLHLFWLEDNNRRVYSTTYNAFIEPPSLQNVQEILSLPRLDPAAAIEAFNAALDHTHTYLFWQIRRGDGTRQVLFSSGRTGSTDFSEPAALAIGSTDEDTVQTSFNSGTVYSVQSGDTPVRYAVPLAGQHPVLPVAVNIGEALGVLYFEAGETLGYQQVTTSGALLGMPQITADRDRYLYLAWAQPTPLGYANLYMVSTRR